MNIDILTLVSAENLNNSNFFTPAADKFPQVMGRFNQWLKSYAEKCKWDALFGNFERAKEYGNGINEDIFKVKIEHLPLEMQIGILFSFLRSENIQIFVPAISDIAMIDVQIRVILDAFKRAQNLLST